MSQEWLTTIAGWTFVSGLQDSACENRVYPAGAKTSYVLNMRNGLPYLSKELFWMAMEDIAKKAKLITGHTWRELTEMIDNRAYEPQPQIYSVKTVAIPEPLCSPLYLAPTTSCHLKCEKILLIGLSISSSTEFEQRSSFGNCPVFDIRSTDWERI